MFVPLCGAFAIQVDFTLNSNAEQVQGPGQHQKELHQPVHSKHEKQCKIFFLAKSMHDCKQLCQPIHEQYQCSIVPQFGMF